MWMSHWLIWLPLVAEGVRVADEGVDAVENVAVLVPREEKVEGKMIRCTVGGAVVFEEAEDVSPFPASLEYVVGADKGVIDIPGIIKIEVDSQSWVAAQLGHWIVPLSYYIFPIEIHSSGTAIQQSLFSDSANWIQRVRITRGSEKITIFAERVKKKKSQQKHIEIEFTGGPRPTVVVDERVTLPAWAYYMPMQGNIISLKVDGKMVFNQAYTTSKFPVVCTPAFFPVNGWNRDPVFLEMWKGFKKWQHQTIDGLDYDQKLTIKNNANTVEISGNGAELVFSRENVEGKVIKCSMGDRDLFEKAEEESAFAASWGYFDRVIPGRSFDDWTGGWMINIPGIVGFVIDLDSLMASDIGNDNFVPQYYSTFPEKDIDPSGAEMRKIWTEEVIDVKTVSITWASHKTIKLSVRVGLRSSEDRVTRLETVHIEFTRGPGTAGAGHYDVKV